MDGANPNRMRGKLAGIRHFCKVFNLCCWTANKVYIYTNIILLVEFASFLGSDRNKLTKRFIYGLRLYGI